MFESIRFKVLRFREANINVQWIACSDGVRRGIKGLQKKKNQAAGGDSRTFMRLLFPVYLACISVLSIAFRF